MELPSNNSQILNHLCLDFDSDYYEYLDKKSIEIEKLNNKLDINESKWAKLNLNRVMCSNTLLHNNRPELQSWDQTNQWVLKQIQLDRSPSLEDLFTINELLTGKKNNFRKDRIFGSGNEYLPPEFLDEGIDLFKNNILEKQFKNPLHKAYEICLWSITLHLFNDGNGRTARFAADWILIKNGLLPLCFPTPVASHIAITHDGKLTKQEGLKTFIEGVQHGYSVIV